jgi:hypothetical protein
MISELSVALEVVGGDAEVAVPELVLDDDQRHAFARHLDSVGVPTRREGPADTCSHGDPSEMRTGGRARPPPAPGLAVHDAEERPDGELNPRLEPRLQFLPAPGVHPDFAAAAALAATDKHRTPTGRADAPAYARTSR